MEAIEEPSEEESWEESEEEEPPMTDAMRYNSYFYFLHFYFKVAYHCRMEMFKWRRKGHFLYLRPNPPSTLTTPDQFRDQALYLVQTVEVARDQAAMDHPDHCVGFVIGK